VLCALAVPGIALAANGGLTPVEPASPNAGRINDAYLWIAIFTGAIFLIVEVALVVFMVRYRRRDRPRTEDGAQVHGNTNIELAWTVAPVLILVAIGAFIFYKLPGIEDVPSANAQNGRLDVEVDGARFYWNFTYDNGVIAVDKLRAPVGQTVRLEVKAPDWDVIHSWWIPALGGKFDAIPGVTNETWFNAEAPGVYKGQCAEFCGIQHAKMTASVEAMPREEFDSWLADEADAQEKGTSTLGRDTFNGVCAKCHGLGGTGDIGPRIQGSQLLGDPKALEQLLREGRGEMPPVGRDWDDRQMQALLDFVGKGDLGGS